MVVTYPEKVELKHLGEKTTVSGLTCFCSEAFDDYCCNNKMTKDDCHFLLSCTVRKILRKLQFSVEFTISLFLR